MSSSESALSLSWIARGGQLLLLGAAVDVAADVEPLVVRAPETISRGALAATSGMLVCALVESARLWCYPPKNARETGVRERVGGSRGRDRRLVIGRHTSATLTTRETATASATTALVWGLNKLRLCSAQLCRVGLGDASAAPLQ